MNMNNDRTPFMASGQDNRKESVAQPSSPSIEATMATSADSSPPVRRTGGISPALLAAASAAMSPAAPAVPQSALLSYYQSVYQKMVRRLD